MINFWINKLDFDSNEKYGPLGYDLSYDEGEKIEWNSKFQKYSVLAFTGNVKKNCLK